MRKKQNVFIKPIRIPKKTKKDVEEISRKIKRGAAKRFDLI